MKKVFISRLLALTLLLGGLCSSCIEEWTENRSIDIDEIDIEKQNPELYAEYLYLLRQYKKTGHRKIYVSFNNSSQIAMSQAQCIGAIPDSVDYVNLECPDLTDWMVEEMEEVRAEKGTKFFYSISYDTILKEYEDKIKKANEGLQEGEEAFIATEEERLSYIAERMPFVLEAARKFNYDGIVIKYNGVGTISDADKQNVRQKAFLDPIIAWKNATEGRKLIFDGIPCNLIDKSVFDLCEIIIVPTSYEVNMFDFEKVFRMYIQEDVPAHKMVPSVRTFNIMDPDDKTTGYIDNESMILKASQWVIEQKQDCSVAGLAIYNVQNDYYNMDKVYKYVREAISLLN